MSFDQLLNQLVGNQQANSQTTASVPGQGGGNGLSIPGGLLGGLAAGGLLGAVVGNKKMRKSATKLAGGMVGLGGAALLGVVAHKAYQNWQQGKPSGAAPAHPGGGQEAISSAPAADMSKFDPAAINSKDGQPFELALVKAMVAAAYADGQVDAAEYGKIFEALDRLDMTPNEKAVFLDLLKSPPTIDEIASLADGLEQASEIYLASRMTIDPDHPSERAYLKELAARMEIPGGLVVHLETHVTEQAEEAA